MTDTHRSDNTSRTQLTLAQVSGEFMSIVGLCLCMMLTCVDSNCVKTMLTVWYSMCLAIKCITLCSLDIYTILMSWYIMFDLVMDLALILVLSIWVSVLVLVLSVSVLVSVSVLNYWVLNPSLQKCHIQASPGVEGSPEGIYSPLCSTLLPSGMRRRRQLLYSILTTHIRE